MTQNKKMTNDSGRSMVEMLGVLAVIGVLSIAGVAGYTTAMNKHRANEILNAASVRAMVVSTQIQRGNTNPTLAEFETNEVGGATFGTSVKNTAGTADFVLGTDNRFTLTLSNVDSDICKQMQSIAGNDGILRDFHSDCSKLTYNNDLTTDAVASDYKTQSDCKAPFQWCSKLGTSGQCVEGNDCCSGITTSTCLICNSSTGAITNASNTTPCKTTSTSTTNDGKCDGNGECKSFCSADNFSSCDQTGCEGLTLMGATFIWITPVGGTSDDAFCAKLIKSDMKWCQARTACGGVENMVLLADLNCSTSGSCGATGIFAKYFWTADCYDENCTNESTCDSGRAWFVGEQGSVFTLDRNDYDTGTYALCK